MSDNPYHLLPAVHQVLERPEIVALEDRHAHDVIISAVRDELDLLRERKRNGDVFQRIDEYRLRVMI